MRVLITGANGMLAKAMREVLKSETLILTARVANEERDIRKMDITNLEEVKKVIKESKPDVIINCAAYTAVDKAELEVEKARAINVEGPRNLATAIMEVDMNIILVHISTDYVFSGKLDLKRCYAEDDAKLPATVYGKTKSEGEEIIRKNTIKYYIFRTAWLYGDGNNFVRTMLRLAKEKDEVNVVCDQYGTPTYTLDLASIIYQALKWRIPYGVYHATNLGYTSWDEFARKVFEIAGVNCKVNSITTDQYPTLAKRPINSRMSKVKILQAKIDIPIWEDALKRYLKEEMR